MRQLQKVRQYQRLCRFTGMVPTTTTISEIASVLLCSIRHTRTLLPQFINKGWLKWLPSPGRGNKGVLQCLVAVSDISTPLMQDSLDKGDYQSALLLADGDPASLHYIISPFMGGRWRRGLPTLSIPFRRTIETLSPALSRCRAERHIIDYVHAGITRFEPGRPTPVPDMAHHWRSYENNTVWNFWLRNSMRWHNGQIIDNAEILHSLELALADPYRNKALQHVAEVGLNEAGVLRIRLTRPDAFLAHQLGMTTFRLPHPAEPETGAGPFAVTAHSTYFTRLEKQAWYYGMQPLLHAIEFWKTEEPTSAGGGSACISVGKPSRKKNPTLSPVTHSGFGFVWGMFSSNLSVPLREYLTIQTGGLARSRLSHRTDLNFTSPIIPKHSPEALEMPFKFPFPKTLNVLCFDSPEAQVLAGLFSDFCLRHSGLVSIRIRGREEWYADDTFEGIDVVFGDFLAAESPTINYATWFWREPAWKHMMTQEDYVAAELKLSQILSTEDNAAENVINFYTSFFLRRFFTPLFQFNYHITPLENIMDIIPTANGWFDFSRVWLPALIQKRGITVSQKRKAECS